MVNDPRSVPTTATMLTQMAPTRQIVCDPPLLRQVPMPLPSGQPHGMAPAWHAFDPGGLLGAVAGAELDEPVGSGRGLPRPSRGLAAPSRRDATRAQRKIKDQPRHQKGTTRSGTGPHGVTQDGTETSRNGPPRYGRGPRVRIDTEALAHLRATDLDAARTKRSSYRRVNSPVLDIRASSTTSSAA